MRPFGTARQFSLDKALLTGFIPDRLAYEDTTCPEDLLDLLVINFTGKDATIRWNNPQLCKFKGKFLLKG
jgi:hypothetical protein